jgi:hypothetical protein
MTYKPKRDSRHITLSKEAIKIYDNWKDNGEAGKVSQAIVQYDSKGTIEAKLEELEKRIERLGKK